MRPPLQSGKPTMDICDWRTQLTPFLRGKIVKKIVETLKKHLPSYSGPDGINELSKIAAKFEDRIFREAVNQTDYLRKISTKMLAWENRSKNAAGSSPSICIPAAANNGTSVLYGVRFIDDHHMDNGNSKPSLLKGEPAVNTGDWRTQLPPNLRQRNAYKIMESLEKHVPNLGLQGINELMRIAANFEDLIFNTAINQVDYFRKISFKMLSC